MVMVMTIAVLVPWFVPVIVIMGVAVVMFVPIVMGMPVPLPVRMPLRGIGSPSGSNAKVSSRTIRSMARSISASTWSGSIFR